MITFHDGPAHEVRLFLERAPFFLRVVLKNDGTWDALDQPGDEPAEDEQIFGYWIRPERMGRAFYDGVKDGRRHGWSSMCATYEFFVPQPKDAAMRTNERWVIWCDNQAATRTVKDRYHAWIHANTIGGENERRR